MTAEWIDIDNAEATALLLYGTIPAVYRQVRCLGCEDVFSDLMHWELHDCWWARHKILSLRPAPLG